MHICYVNFILEKFLKYFIFFTLGFKLGLKARAKNTYVLFCRDQYTRFTKIYQLKLQIRFEF